MSKARRILIIGANGFVGKNLIQLFLQNGDDVTATSRRNPPSLVTPYKHCHLDLTDKATVQEYFQASDHEYVINASGYINHATTLPEGRSIIDVHLGATRNIVNALLTSTSLKRYIHLGSSDEYGSSPSPQTESIREQPFSFYSYAKVSATHYLQTIAKLYGFPCTIIRPFLLYGPSMSQHRFLGSLIAALKNDLAFPMSYGEQVRDFTHIKDLFSLILCLFSSNELLGEVVNVGSGEPVTIKNVASFFDSRIPTGRVLLGAIPYRDNENMLLFPSLVKVHSSLGWKPSIPPYVGFKDLL